MGFGVLALCTASHLNCSLTRGKMWHNRFICNLHKIVSTSKWHFWPRLRTSPPPLYVNQTHEDWSLPAYSVFRAGRDPARHLFFRRGGNRKSQCRATGRPVGQRQSGAAFGYRVTIFTCNLRCKVPCSILHATLSFWNAHNKENSVQISGLQEQ